MNTKIAISSADFSSSGLGVTSVGLGVISDGVGITVFVGAGVFVGPEFPGVGVGVAVGLEPAAGAVVGVGVGVIVGVIFSVAEGVAVGVGVGVCVGVGVISVLAPFTSGISYCSASTGISRKIKRIIDKKVKNVVALFLSE